MLYFGYNLEMGNEDAYDQVLDGEHRDIVNKPSTPWFNQVANYKPDKINMNGLEMS